MKKYVAIVDDDSSFAAYLGTFLSLRGYEARCYTRGDEFLASIEQKEQPDVVLLDVMRPRRRRKWRTDAAALIRSVSRERARG